MCFHMCMFSKFERVVPEVRIVYQLSANLEQVIVSICLDKEREWNLTVQPVVENVDSEAR